MQPIFRKYRVLSYAGVFVADIDEGLLNKLAGLPNRTGQAALENLSIMSPYP
jgi:hypothetical protein